MAMKVIISGGGTGGHIFPALSIAQAIERLEPDADILFVGAEGRMEMTRVPAAGYKIVGLPVAGFERKKLWKNFSVILKLIRSLTKAYRVVKDFAPDVAVGVGGYASGPTLFMANRLSIPTLLQEQNSYPGVTNKLLAQKASLICVAYSGLERFFPPSKLLMTGNPVRDNLLHPSITRMDGYNYFGLSSELRTLLVVGGSLGARTINDSLVAGLERILAQGHQVIWQTGKYYYTLIEDQLGSLVTHPSLRLVPFVEAMDAAYLVADLIVSRAGASSISELSLLGKPTILVPSPNVSEDHQTHNAVALVNSHAAVMVKDVEATTKLVDRAIELLSDNEELALLSQNIRKLAFDNASSRIAEEIINIVTKRKQ